MAIPAQSGAVVICPMEAHLGGTQTADHEANASEDIARDVAGGGLRVAKRPWQPAEDDRLLELVQRFGPHRWGKIASHLPGRIGKQCRERCEPRGTQHG